MIIKASLSGKRFLGGDSYLIPPNEELVLTIPIEPSIFPKATVKQEFNIKVSFDDSSEKQSVSFTTEGNNTTRMTLFKWDSGLATALNKSYPVMNIDGDIVELMLSNVRIGETNFLTAQFWIKSE